MVLLSNDKIKTPKDYANNPSVNTNIAIRSMHFHYSDFLLFCQPRLGSLTLGIAINEHNKI